jgi:hypothetical protein
MIVVSVVSGLLVVASLAQAIRIGLKRGDWIAAKLLGGFIAGAGLLVFVAAKLVVGR